MAADVMRWTKEYEEAIGVGIAALLGGYIGYRIGKRPCPTASEDFGVGVFTGALVFGGAGILIGNYYGDGRKR